jgi:peptidoglycan/LPS O-acetylase OafA/YrhL
MWGGVVRLLVSYCIGIILWRTWRDQPALRVSPGFALAAMPLLFAGGALSSGPSLVLGMAFILAICPMMIAGGLAIRQSMPVLSWLGEISFPLYAVHVPMFRLIKLTGGGMVLSFAATFAVAWLFVWLPRKLKQQPRSAAQAGIPA